MLLNGIYQYKNLKFKVLKCCADIFFNRQCLTKKIIPNDSNIKVPVTSPALRIYDIPLSNIFLYLKQNVLYWPDDDRLRSKHVATV